MALQETPYRRCLATRLGCASGRGKGQGPWARDGRGLRISVRPEVPETLYTPNIDLCLTSDTNPLHWASYELDPRTSMAWLCFGGGGVGRRRKAPFVNLFLLLTLRNMPSLMKKGAHRLLPLLDSRVPRA